MTKKPDEIALIGRLYDAADGEAYETFRDTIDEVALSGDVMDWNRCKYILLKWCEKGYMGYGTNPAGGWFTPDGLERAREVIGDD